MCVSAAAERENQISSPQAVEAAYSKTKQNKKKNTTALLDPSVPTAYKINKNPTWQNAQSL